LKIVVHYPETEEGRRRLMETISDLHAILIIDSIERLPWDRKDKTLLLDEIKKEIKLKVERKEKCFKS